MRVQGMGVGWKWGSGCVRGWGGVPYAARHCGQLTVLPVVTRVLCTLALLLPGGACSGHR